MLLVLVVLLAAAVVAVWFALSAKLRLERELREQERASAQALREESAKCATAVVEGALERFRNVSNDALKANGEAFRSLNADELERILKPLRESVSHYDEAARKSLERSGQLEVRLNAHMSTLGQAAEKFSAGATNFVNAITGGNKVAGNWGEAVLDQILSDCGLVRDVNYIAQGGGTGNIPDYQVFDAASRKILVIDAKVSWKKYKEMSESDDPAVREAALLEHVESVRRQIDSLSGRKYHENPNPPRTGYAYLPFCAMFVPSDAALWEAVKRDPAIPAYADSKGVVLLTPTTLFGFLRLVHEGWALYNTQRNQDEIARQAALVIERIDRFFRSLEEADAALTKAHEKLAQAVRLASSEGASIVTPAQRIVRLSEKSERQLKSKMLAEATAE